MLKIYFDDVLIDEDSYTALNDDYQLFTDSFKLGSTASNSFKLSVNKSMVSNQPIEVKIEDDNTTFYLVVDSIAEDKYTYTYTLTDKLLNFNFKYDASEIINAKAELEETCYLSDIWHDMCDKADVEYDDTYTFLNDIEVTWYDSTIQARKYLSYIAELQSGYACILPNGKQSFKPHKKASSKTISIDECSDFILGEKKTITRVVYDVGTIKWEFGDETGATVYLDTTNVFITNEDIVEAIYDGIVGFEFYLVDVPNAPMDSDIRAGDVITFTDGTNNYPTIAQYSMSYSGDWVGSFSLKITTSKQQETNVVGTKESISKIQSDINRIDGTLTITARKDELVSLINLSPEEIKILSNKIRLEGYTTINGSFAIDEDGTVSIGGILDGSLYNLLPNSSGLEDLDKWTISHTWNQEGTNSGGVKAGKLADAEAWTAKIYILGDLCSYNGKIYMANTSRYQDGTFLSNSAYWDAISIYTLFDAGNYFRINARISVQPEYGEYLLSNEIIVKPLTTYNLSAKNKCYPERDLYEGHYNYHNYHIQIIESFNEAFSNSKVTELFIANELYSEAWQNITKTFITDLQTKKLKIKIISESNAITDDEWNVANFIIADILLDEKGIQRDWTFNSNDEVLGSTQINNSSFKVSDVDGTTELIKISKGGVYSKSDIKTDGSLTFENDINGITKAELNCLDGVTSNIQTQLNDKLKNVVEDTTPQLGGDLDTNGHNITGAYISSHINNRVYAKYTLSNPSARANVGSVNAEQNGGLMKILAHGHSAGGDSTYVAEYLVRLGYSGDYYSVVKYPQPTAISTLDLKFSVSNSNLIVQTNLYNVILYVERYG